MAAKEFVEVISVFLSLSKSAVLILPVLFTALICVLGYWVRAYLRASAEFRNTIYAEFEGLYPTPVNWPEYSMDIVCILKEKYPRFEVAVHKFKAHLPTCFVKGFNRAWVTYYNESGVEGFECYYHYVPFSGTSITDGKQEEHDNTKTYKDNFKHNVDNLLKYAKTT